MSNDSLERLEKDRLVEGWLAHAERGPEDDEFFWAWDTMCSLVRDRPETAWPLIQSLIALSPSDRVLANIAAGPLEDLLCWHGPSFIDRILAAASGDAHFRRCLRAVWGWDSMNKEIRARVDDAVQDIVTW